MPWVSRREMARLERERSAAFQRAQEAEQRLMAERERLDSLLASERQNANWTILQLTSRVVTKHGGYGLDYEPQPKEIPATVNPSGYTHEPTQQDYDYLEWLKSEAKTYGRPESEAIAYWEARMRGEMPVVEDGGEQ